MAPLAPTGETGAVQLTVRPSVTGVLVTLVVEVPGGLARNGLTGVACRMPALRIPTLTVPPAPQAAWVE